MEQLDLQRPIGAEQQTRRLVGAGAGLALFVALLGLVGLTGFTV